MGRRKRELSQEEKNIIIKMHGERKSDNAIAEIIGVSFMYVRKHRLAMGLETLQRVVKPVYVPVDTKMAQRRGELSKRLLDPL